MFKFLFWLCGDAFRFVREWFVSRSVRPLLQGSPAVFCFFGVVALIWLGRQSTAKELQHTYLEKAENALANDELVEADLYYRKVVQMAPDLPAGLLGQAKVAERNGKETQAQAIMLRLANNQNYAPAYMWLAERMLKDGKSIPPQMVPTLTHLLLSAVKHDPDQHRAHAMLGQILFAHRSYANALPHFSAAARRDDKMLLPLARTLLMLGRIGDARAHANMAITRFEEQLADEPDNHLTRNRMIDALMFVGRYSESLIMVSDALSSAEDSAKSPKEMKRRLGYARTLARLYTAWSRDLWLEQPKDSKQMQQALLIQEQRARAREELHKATQHFSAIIQSKPTEAYARLRLGELNLLNRKYAETETLLWEGWELAETDSARQEQFRVALVRTNVEWAAFLAKDSDDPNQSIQILERTLKVAPDDKAVALQLVLLAAKFDIKSGKARELFDQMLAKNELPAQVHLLLGTNATQADDHKKALLHLERALELEPKNQSVKNNLAWTLSHLDPPQLDRARELIDSAVEQSPKHLEVRATRADILIQQQEWKLALADLELAAKHLGDRDDIRIMLAKVRAKLGSEPGKDE